MGAKHWTETELEFIKRNYKMFTTQQLADMIGKSFSATSHMKARLNLSKGFTFKGKYNRNEEHRKKMSSVKEGKDPFSGDKILRKRQADKLRTGWKREDGYKGSSINGRSELEHRRVWRKAFGEIPKGFHIHHKNGDKKDNRLENLELISASEHTKLHRSRL